MDNNVRNLLIGITVMVLALLAVAPSGRAFLEALIKLAIALIIVAIFIGWLAARQAAGIN